ncbi:MAG TPA: hypothetical protein VEA78_03375 [Acidimicrobiales bacterium]|nr:hypothetical protein [Acidimicrobiales bacterium]
MDAAQARAAMLRRACVVARAVLVELDGRSLDLADRRLVRDAVAALELALSDRPLTVAELTEIARRGRHAAGVRAGTHRCAACDAEDLLGPTARHDDR